MYKLLLLSVLAVVPMAASAHIPSEGGSFSPDKGLDLSTSFAAQHSAILAALKDGKTYSEISPDDRQQVVASLDRISGLLGANASPAQLSEAERLEVFNEQERVNTLLTRARSDSRLLCTREKPVGSHRPVSKCMTVAERRRAQDNSQQALQQMQHRPINGANP